MWRLMSRLGCLCAFSLSTINVNVSVFRQIMAAEGRACDK